MFLVKFGVFAGGSDAEGHVGIFGVGEDEVFAAGRIGVNARQLLIERLAHIRLTQPIHVCGAEAFTFASHSTTLSFRRCYF